MSETEELLVFTLNLVNFDVRKYGFAVHSFVCFALAAFIDVPGQLIAAFAQLTAPYTFRCVMTL